ncbi:DNA repair protein RAD50-like [Nilaparvata lugens]|uniref:DNA repair protein RAD50-like n=1 Tax=Nilaparvata lugens TaxID=108931 RepID=UPI00193D27F1|nr:DNA repair protein RAD50-like [Nilaparvata lugens]
MGNSSETMALIKLRIFDVHSKPVVVSRTMKNTQKLKSMEFKTIDQTITYEKNTISNRCIDTDEQMCNFIGVSKPILNYVIFCHQEQSCWPMEEGKTVKERFDQIFDADNTTNVWKRYGK